MISEDIVTLKPAGLAMRITDISVMTITDDASWISVMSLTTGESKVRRKIMSTTKKLRDHRRVTPPPGESRVNPRKMLPARISRMRVEKEIN